MISVVLSNYNGARYLAETIESVLAQDFADYEFVIVDDGSTDASESIIAQFAGRRPDKIRPVLLPENRGQGPGFNAGIGASRGELVSFLDSDDIWFPEKLRRAWEAYRNHPGMAVYQHNLFLLEEGKVTDKRFHDVLMAGDYFLHTQRKKWLPQFAPTSGLFIPRRVLDKALPIPEQFRICADGFLTRSCFVHGDVWSTGECWGAYRVHGANNVFGNNGFNDKKYISDLLVPALNDYYGRQGIEYRYSRSQTDWILTIAFFIRARVDAVKRVGMRACASLASCWREYRVKQRHFLSHQHNVIRDAGREILRRLLPERLFRKIYQTMRRKE